MSKKRVHFIILWVRAFVLKSFLYVWQAAKKHGTRSNSEARTREPQVSKKWVHFIIRWVRALVLKSFLYVWRAAKKHGRRGNSDVPGGRRNWHQRCNWRQRQQFLFGFLFLLIYLWFHSYAVTSHIHFTGHLILDH